LFGGFSADHSLGKTQVATFIYLFYIIHGTATHCPCPSVPAPLAGVGVFQVGEPLQPISLSTAAYESLFMMQGFLFIQIGLH